MPPAEHAIDDKDLLLASRLQSSLLPRKCPDDCSHHRIGAVNRMCGGVGGDFYDFIRINDDQLAVVIGDVVGHGIRASLIMAQIMGFLRTGKDRISRPMQMLDTLNMMLIDTGLRSDSVITCTMFYLVIDAPTGTGFFVNAGHPRPILLGNDGADPIYFGGTDMFLGMDEFSPEEGCHTFEPGERLVLYTDGITEAGAPADTFGDERLVATVADHRGDAPEQCANRIVGAVDDFRGDAERSDDETVIVIDRI